MSDEDDAYAINGDTMNVGHDFDKNENYRGGDSPLNR